MEPILARARIAIEKCQIITASADFGTDVTVTGDQFFAGSCEYLRDLTTNARITDRGENLSRKQT